MIGHGGPGSSSRSIGASASTRRPRSVGLRAVCSLLALWAASGGWERHVVAQETELRLRVEWGSAVPQRWVGSLELSQGRLEDVVPLGMEPDEAGSIWLEGRQILVRSGSERSYDGVDVTVHAPRDAKWIVKLFPAAHPGGAAPIEIPLESLAIEQASAALPGPNALVVMRRAPGDMLRVDVRRDHLIFEPEETWAPMVQPHALGLPANSRLRLTAELRPAAGGQALWSASSDTMVAEDGTVAGAELQLVLPRQEGVYNLHLELTRRDLPSRLALRQAIAERVVQLVVVSGAPAEVRTPPPDHVVLEIDPAKPGWWKRWTHLPWLPGLRRGPLGSGHTERWEDDSGQVLMQLGPGGREPEIDWEAYPLAVSMPGQPHLLEIEYATHQPQSLGVSILEPNAAGRLSPIGLDAGVYVDNQEGEGTSVATYRLVFWPQTRSPLLLLTNRQQGTRAAFGRLRVLGPRLPTVPMPLARSHEGAALPRLLAEPLQGSRLLAAYFDRPLFPNNFGAPETQDPATGRALHDWQTFYLGATRLIEYLHHTGRNALVLPALADGSAIYPTRLVDATPRYDTGIYHAHGLDPVRKDVLELLLRLCDREGLVLIPTFHFTTPLSALEALKRNPDQAVGLELIGNKGQTWLTEHAARGGLAPYYNPLDPRVQDAMLEVLRELVERYSEHQALAGVAIILSADGYAQLPGVDWGLDPKTLARFARETRADLPADLEARRKVVLEEPLRSRWIAWRAQTIGRALHHMQQELAKIRPGLRLFVCGGSMFDRPHLQDMLLPRPGKPGHYSEALAAVGIVPEHWPANDDVVFVRPIREAPPTLLAEQPGHALFNQAIELDAWCGRQAHPACLIYHPPLLARLPSFDARSPFPDSRLWLVSQLAPARAENRKRLAQALATLDARVILDGGWLLPLGEEVEQRNLIHVYRALPDQPLSAVEGAPQPLVARVANYQGGTLLCVINDSPWPVQATVDIRTAAGCTATSLAPDVPGPTPSDSSGHSTWRFELKPYDAAAVRFSSPASLSDWQVALPDRAVAYLEDRLRELWARAALLRKPPPREAIANAGFEEPAEMPGKISGWQTDGDVSVDRTVSHHGRQSVLLRPGMGPARLRTAPLDPPRLGRAEVTAWMRTSKGGASPRIRLLLESTDAGKPFRRTARPSTTPSEEWSQISFTFGDLPTVGLGKVRFRFEADGPGTVWLDDVEWFDLSLSEQERRELSKAILLAQHKFEREAYRDCLSALDGYWPRLLSAAGELAPYTVARHPRRDVPDAASDTQPPGMLDRVRQLLPPFLR